MIRLKKVLLFLVCSFSCYLPSSYGSSDESDKQTEASASDIKFVVNIAQFFTHVAGVEASDHIDALRNSLNAIDNETAIKFTGMNKKDLTMMAVSAGISFGYGVNSLSELNNNLTKIHSISDNAAKFMELPVTKNTMICNPNKCIPNVYGNRVGDFLRKQKVPNNWEIGISQDVEDYCTSLHEGNGEHQYNRLMLDAHTEDLATEVANSHFAAYSAMQAFSLAIQVYEISAVQHTIREASTHLKECDDLLPLLEEDFSKFRNLFSSVRDQLALLQKLEPNSHEELKLQNKITRSLFTLNKSINAFSRSLNSRIGFLAAQEASMKQKGTASVVNGIHCAVSGGFSLYQACTLPLSQGYKLLGYGLGAAQLGAAGFHGMNFYEIKKVLKQLDKRLVTLRGFDNIVMYLLEMTEAEASFGETLNEAS